MSWEYEITEEAQQQLKKLGKSVPFDRGRISSLAGRIRSIWNRIASRDSPVPHVAQRCRALVVSSREASM